MPAPKPPQQGSSGNRADDDEDGDLPLGARCPFCELAAGDCDHLLASIDLTYSEFVAGAIFSHERVIFDLLEHLVAADPDDLKVAGAGPVLEHVALAVQAEIEEGASAGDAVAIHFPQIIAAVSHMLQEDEAVTTTAIDEPAVGDSSVENLWAENPEPIVERLIERLEELTSELDAG